MNRSVALLILAAALVICSEGAPLGEGPEKIYDQRQNGTENYRINIDGVFVMIAPAEDILNAAQGVDLEQLISLAGEEGLAGDLAQLKPGQVKPAPLNATKPEKKHGSSDSSASSTRLRQRFLSIIRPILKRIRPAVV